MNLKFEIVFIFFIKNKFIFKKNIIIYDIEEFYLDVYIFTFKRDKKIK